MIHKGTDIEPTPFALLITLHTAYLLMPTAIPLQTLCGCALCAASKVGLILSL